MSNGQKLIVMVVAIALFVVVMGLVLWLVDRPKRVPSWVVALAFAGIPLIALAWGLVRPAILTIYNSFLKGNGTESAGFSNYVTAFTQPAFRQILINTAVWTIAVPVLATVFGLVYAVIVDRSRFEKLAKALVFIPMAISMVGASIIWQFMYAFRGEGFRQLGLLNQVLVWLGLPPQDFLLTQPWNTGFLIVVLVWIQTGFAMTVLSAAIKAIPDDIIEAARLDGLGGGKMFRYITVPSIRPALIVVLTTIAIASLKVFDIVRTLGSGGQGGTSVIANEFYTLGFTARRDQGLASALAVLLFILVIPIIVYNVRQLRKTQEIR
jgi:alpha-glucoside transport system permease protein